MNLNITFTKNKKYNYFINMGIKGFLVSLVLFFILLKTRVLIFSIFPLLFFIGYAAYVYNKKTKAYEYFLFVFLDDLKDLLQGGMNIVTAMEILNNHDYSVLNEDLKRITAQVKIGISFDVALITVFSEIDSKLYYKVSQVIAESMKYGGNLINIFTSVSNYVKKVNEMNQERKSKSFSTVFSSYFMFFVFMGIILIIQIVFLPMLTGTVGMNPGDTETVEDVNFNAYFLYLLIIQGGFAGPIIGKISESDAVSGIKHSIILISVSVPLYVLVSILFI